MKHLHRTQELRFVTAWQNVTQENYFLKLALGLALLSSIGLSIGLTRAVLKPPIILDRSCATTTTQPASTQHTDAEVQAFIRQTIAQRFNSDETPIETQLSAQDIKLRNIEQSELTSKGMRQRVFVNAIKITDGSVLIDADRLISVGTIRSAFSFPLSASLKSVDRTPVNPYGLFLERISLQPPPTKAPGGEP